MKIKIRSAVIDIICLLYIVLFVYAAVSKILDYENFRVQLGQSPLLTAFADWVAVCVPAIEILIALLLLPDRTRFIGLFGSFSLMVMFTTYIVIILNFSEFIPCSCGGILEKLGWTEHFIFNCGFIVLALIGLVLIRKKALRPAIDPTPKGSYTLIRKKSFIMAILITFVTSIVLIIVLYLLSEHEVHRNNGLVRRLPHHPAKSIRGLNIKLNSYYIAGFDQGRVYLGNVSAPLNLLSVDTATLKDVKDIRMKLENSHNYPFASVQVRIRAPYFFIADGKVPGIFRGKMSDWYARPFMTDKKTYFNLLEPIDSSSFGLRAMNITDGNILGNLTVGSHNKLQLATGLLQKKTGDGLFDTDGMLSYNEELQQLVYVYYYRNQYITANRDFTQVYRTNTIDTLKESTLNLVTVKSRHERKFATHPTKLQQYSTSSGNYLFVKSERLGKYEPEVMLRDAGIIDVYDLNKHTYEFSFYLYNYEGEKVKTFKVYGNLLFGLTEHYLVCYRLKSQYFHFR